MEKVEANTGEDIPVQLFRYRWVILLLFCVYACINFVQFLQYSIISNIMAKYYQVGSFMIDLTAIVFMVTFIVLCMPANYVIERYNLRITAVLSSGLTAVGSLIKLGSASPDRFYVVMIGQTLCGIAQVFMLSIPAKLASTWFGADEVSTACAIAIFGTQIGIAIGSITSPNLVRNSNQNDEIGEDVFNLMIYTAVASCVAFLLVVLFFRAKPRLPPSQSQISMVETHRPSLVDSLKTLVRNRDYLILLVIFGISNGLWTAVGLLINTIYLDYFPRAETDVGLIVLISVIVGGCIGSVIFGLILDKTHQFRLVSFSCIFISAISFIGVVASFETQSKTATYIVIPFFAFFLASTLVLSFEFATEATYPIPEAISCAIMNAVIYIFAVVFTLIFEICLPLIGYIATFSIVFVILLISAALIYFISPNLRRRQANVQDS